VNWLLIWPAVQIILSVVWDFFHQLCMYSFTECFGLADLFVQ
jgi:hypothetical protein